MNFSLKKNTKVPPPRVKLGEVEEKIQQPEKVRQVELAKSHELEIKLPSNTNWILSASEKSEKRAIELESSAQTNPYLSEEVLYDKAYTHDVEDHPDAPSPEAYDELSVEEFGAALLRGLGKEPEISKSNIKAPELKQRPALLGIGAKAGPGKRSTQLNVPLTKRRKKSTEPSFAESKNES